MEFKSFKDKTGFCILPFIHQEKKFNGTYHICCYGDQLQSDNNNDTSLDSFNSTKLNQIRSAMLADERPSACDTCYRQEDQGIYSPRMRENDSWYKWDSTHTAVNKCLTAFLEGNRMLPISYDLRYSNTCTLKCRMCNSSSSSSVNAEYIKLNSLWPEKFWTIGNHRINHEIELHEDIQKIYLAGGEPLVEPLNLELLKSVADYNNTLVILINTSLNIVSDKFLEILDRFKYLTLVVSIDGTDIVNDYIRKGSNFDVVKENIRKLYHHDIMFSTCVSMYNIFNIKKLVEFINTEFPQYSSNHGINIVNDIEELYVENVPYELRADIISELQECLKTTKDFPAAGIKNLISLLEQNNFDYNRFQKFIRYTKILDTARNESISQVVPQLAKYFNE